MKKSVRGWVVLLCASLLFFISALYFIIPKAAAITLPFRWNRVPLQQKRPVVLQYFGNPADSSVRLTDKWVAPRNNGTYVLVIKYSADSLAQGYQLYFNYKWYFLEKDYLLFEEKGDR